MQAAVLSLLVTPACRGDDSAEAETEQAEGESEGETGEPAALGDVCEAAEIDIEAPTRVRASLRHATPSPIGTPCGATGPVVFAHVNVAGRVDLTVGARGRAFTPKLAIQRPGCVSAEADPERLLACADALPVTLFDIGPDVELLVAIGIAADDPALELPAPAESEEDGELDPLELELDFELRAVLGEGSACGPDHGRCEAGTVCLPEDEDGVEVDRCRRPPADSCVAPGELILPDAGLALELLIPPDEPHSDAHEHACTGWRRPDRVERLEFPPGLPQDATLVVRAEDPRVGLALRGPGCAPEHALACMPANTNQNETVLAWGGNGELAALADAGETALLFIELPRSDLEPEPLEPITLTLEIVSG